MMLCVWCGKSLDYQYNHDMDEDVLTGSALKEMFDTMDRATQQDAQGQRPEIVPANAEKKNGVWEWDTRVFWYSWTPGTRFISAWSKQVYVSKMSTYKQRLRRIEHLHKFYTETINPNWAEFANRVHDICIEWAEEDKEDISTHHCDNCGKPCRCPCITDFTKDHTDPQDICMGCFACNPDEEWWCPQCKAPRNEFSVRPDHTCTVCDHKVR